MRSASCSVCIASSASGTQRADFGRGGDDVLAQLGVALLRHRRAADRAGRHRLLDLAELGLHQRVDLARRSCRRSRPAGRGGRCSRRDGRRSCATAPRIGSMPRCRPIAGLHRRARARRARQRCRRRRRASRQRCAAPPGASARHGGSARRSTPRACSRRSPAPRAGHACARRSACRRRARRDRPSPTSASPISSRKMPVRLAQHQQVAGLGDVLRRRAPMHPAAMRLADDAAQFPDQRHDRVAGARETLVDAGRGRAVRDARPRAIASAASLGMMPSSACALASAASTSSQACQRFSSR